VVFSDLLWFVPELERPREAVEFWAANPPRMLDEIALHRRCGSSYGYAFFGLERA
jgi:hypothetical protein